MKESDEERFLGKGKGKSAGLVSDSGLKLSTIEVFKHVNNK